IPDSPVVKDPGCHAVDFLFVIDDSGSMADDQAKLIANFPTFAMGIIDTLDQVTSYQVGVVTTDAYTFNSPGCQTIGSLVTKTGGFDSSNMQCGPYADGYNFMTENDDLAAEFACAAQVGTNGDGFERPMDAVVNVMSEVQDGPGLCNEDFLREEALLVIVVITDEYDGPGDPEGGSSMGDHNTWYEAVLEAKNDTPENAVALALVQYNGGFCPPVDIFSDGAEIIAWVELFEENGFYGGICEADYGPIFAQATEVIEEACNNFIPPN
ncbi:MAG TPA: vWA domain-containing protein, partial [Nannocystaceae bacterium]|nr:vWA domain-containing protein [Nannocystaceae bacterium]